MGLSDKIKSVAKAIGAEAVVAKANHDAKTLGYDPKDYAGFNGEGLPADPPAAQSAYEKWRLRDINGD